jgi:hypothetical protein
MSGASVSVMASVGRLPVVIAAAAPNNSSIFRVGAVCTGTIAVLNNGTMTWAKSAPASYLVTPTTPKDWITPSGGTPGNSYWVKGTDLGAAGYSNCGVVLALTGTQSFTLTGAAGGPASSGTLRLQIYSDSGGSNLVDTGDFTMTCDGT